MNSESVLPKIKKSEVNIYVVASLVSTQLQILLAAGSSVVLAVERPFDLLSRSVPNKTLSNCVIFSSSSDGGGRKMRGESRLGR